MSDQNDEITLAHDEYIAANGINTNDLPKELDAELDSVNDKIDAYEADPTDVNFDATEKASAELKVKIQKWFESKQSAPAPTVDPPKAPEVKAEPKTEPKTEPVTQTQASTTPAQAAPNEEEEDDSWSYTSLMK